MPNYVVIVLGDIGRSPRMQNHCVCLSHLPESEVHVVGYTESQIFSELSESKNVHIHRIRPFIDLPRYLFPIYAPIKILWLFLQLLTLFIRLPRFELIVSQNPPSIPTIPFCLLLKFFKGQRYVIDWHNLGYSLLKVHKVPNIIIKISKYLEIFFGRFADGHITVTKSLQEFLLNENIQSTVVYDRPSPLFRYCPELRTRYSEELNINSEDIWVITSTSWTPDEDINILLTASDYLEEILEGNSRSLSFIITGIGPGRRSFESEVKGRNYRNISFYFEFLQYEKYAELLGTCDVGVSLHKSSSGIDLPMKGLDMIGAGLPLLSIEYQSIRELVEEGENGLLFNDGKELSEIIRKLFVSNEISIEGLREGSIKSGRKKWTEEWNLHAKGVFFVKD